LTYNTTETHRLPVLIMVRELGLGGGIERDVSKFARHLPAWGIDPHVVCFQRGGARFDEIEQAGIPIHHQPLRSFRSYSFWQAAWWVRRYLSENKIDIVHAFDFGTDIFATVTRPLTAARIVITSHLWRRGSLDRSSQRALAVTDRLASAYFVNCNAVRHELQTESNVDATRVGVCHNGFEAHEFHSQGRERPPELRDASTIFGTVAVFREEKNLSLLVDAFADVAKIDQRARLILVGDGALGESLRQQAKDLCISDSVHFYPLTSKPAQWMRAIDVYVLPSRSEAFSNALLEAMACGCCPVASDIGGTKELVEHGNTGLLFKVGDRDGLARNLKLLALDAELRKQMAARAEEFVLRNFTIEVATEKLSQLYRDFLARASRRSRSESGAVLPIGSTR
jgi:L-malate glycosyltransferase